MNHPARTSDALPVLHTPGHWTLDAAVLGGVAGTSGMGWLLLEAPDPNTVVLLTAALGSGALSGVLWGRPMRAILDGLRRRISLRATALVMPVVGALWGATAGAMMLASLVQILGPGPGPSEMLMVLAAVFAPLGAVMVGLLWLPYAVTAVLRLPRWPVVLAAAALAPLLTWILSTVFFLS